MSRSEFLPDAELLLEEVRDALDTWPLERLAEQDEAELARLGYLAGEAQLAVEAVLRAQDGLPGLPLVSQTAAAARLGQRVDEALALQRAERAEELLESGAFELVSFEELRLVLRNNRLGEHADLNHELLRTVLRAFTPADALRITLSLNEEDELGVVALDLAGGTKYPSPSSKGYDVEPRTVTREQFGVAADGSSEELEEDWEDERDIKTSDWQAYFVRYQQLGGLTRQAVLALPEELRQPTGEEGHFSLALRSPERTLASFDRSLEPMAQKSAGELADTVALLRGRWLSSLDVRLLNDAWDFRHAAEDFIGQTLEDAGLSERHFTPTVKELLDLDAARFAECQRLVRACCEHIYATIPFRRAVALRLVMEEAGYGLHTLFRVREAEVHRTGIALGEIDPLAARELADEELEREFLALRPLYNDPRSSTSATVRPRFASLARERLRRSLRHLYPQARYALFTSTKKSRGSDHMRFMGLTDDTLLDPGTLQQPAGVPLDLPWAAFAFEMFDRHYTPEPGKDPSYSVLDLTPFAAEEPDPAHEAALLDAGVELAVLPDEQGRTLSYAELTALYTKLDAAVMKAGPGSRHLALPRLDSIMRWQFIRHLSDRDGVPDGAAYYVAVVQPFLALYEESEGPVLGAEPGFGVVGLGYYDAEHNRLGGATGDGYNKDWPTVRCSEAIFDEKLDDEARAPRWAIKLDLRR